MRKPSPFLCALFAFTVSAAFINPARAAERERLTSSAPSGFENLTSEREAILDAWFGGRKVGEIRAMVRPGFVTFHDAKSIALLIPDVALLPQLVAALTGPMQANVSLACSPSPDAGCGILEPEHAGIILDEERFRVDIFVHPGLLAQPDPAAAYYLAAPVNQPSLVSLFGGTVSGSSRGALSWQLQNRSIASVGDFRLRSDSSLTQHAGVTFDNLTVETDRHDWRFLGGIFWSPGTELIGRRRIVGLGAATQLDTRLNKTELLGTPLEVYLQQTAKVDLIIDDRIVSSRIYPSGNRLIDTATLPNGSYEVVLRIQEDGRPAREEQRFFTKGSSMAPLGRPMFSGFVGLLPSSSRGLSLGSKTVFYQAGVARRMTPSLGFEAAILGTQYKAILDSGAIYHSSFAQLRLGALVSTSGDHGVSVRATTVGHGPLSLSFDLRKISSRDGRPLLPVSTSRGSFSEETKLGFADRGSFTQALSLISYRIDRATFRLTGLFRKNANDAANYSVGASVEIPVVRSSGWDITVLADARKTERDYSSFLGFRFFANRRNVAVSGSGGMIHQTVQGTPSSRLVGEAQASWQRQFEDRGQLSSDVAIGQNADGAYSRGSTHLRSRTFNGRADVLHQFGDRDTTQFAAALDTGIVMTKSGIGVAGRDMNDTGIIVSIAGGGAEQKFDVLIDEVVRGTVEDGERLVLFLQPYQKYDIRVRARDFHISGFENTPRSITLYPGNVAELDWKVTPLFILFGRAVTIDGTPVANANISGSQGVSRSDGDGYFQIETNDKDRLQFGRETASVCNVTVDAAQTVNGFVSAGDQICR